MDELCTFDPIKLAEPVIQVVHVDGVGDVKYAPLNMKDYMELKEMDPAPNAGPDETPLKDDKVAYDVGLEMAYRMLVKAYPELTKDHLLAWPPDILTKVSKALLDTGDFRVKKLESGSG